MYPSQRSRSRGTRSLRATALPARRLKPPCLKALPRALSAPLRLAALARSRRLAAAGAPRVLRVAAAPLHCRPRPFDVWEAGRLTAKGPRLRSLLFALAFRSAPTRRSEKPTAKAAAKRCRCACGSFALASYHNPLHAVKVKPLAVLRNLDRLAACDMQGIRGAKNKRVNTPPPRNLAGGAKHKRKNQRRVSLRALTSSASA